MTSSKSYRALLIDPERRTVEEKWIADPVLPHIHKLLKAECLDFFRAAEHVNTVDQGVVDDAGLQRGQPVHAFKFDNSPDPVAGRCLILGVAIFSGDTIDAKMPLAFALEHIEWLGLIRPRVVWEHSERRSFARVSYEVIS